MAVNPARRDLIIWKGATFRRKLVLFEGELEGPTIDLSGHTGEVNIKNKPNGTIIKSMNSDNGGVTTSADGIEIYMSDAETASLNWIGAVYELRIKAPNGDVDTLLYGKITAKGF